jgi:hypothetical protein
MHRLYADITPFLYNEPGNLWIIMRVGGQECSNLSLVDTDRSLTKVIFSF